MTMIRSKKFECTLCTRQFIQKRHMKNHLAQYHDKVHQMSYKYEEVSINGRKVFSCSICGRLFKQKRSIVRHQFQVHGFAPTTDSLHTELPDTMEITKDENMSLSSAPSSPENECNENVPSTSNETGQVSDTSELDSVTHHSESSPIFYNDISESDCDSNSLELNSYSDYDSSNCDTFLSKIHSYHLEMG